MRERAKVYLTKNFLLAAFFFPLLAGNVLLGCAQKEGKPTPKFKVLEFFPPNNFSLSQTDIVITASFSKLLDQKTINKDNIKVYKDGAEIDVEIRIVNGQKIEIRPRTSLTPGRYKVVISKNVRSITGEVLGQEFSWEFSVVEGEPPTGEIPPPLLPPLVKEIYPPHNGMVGRDTIVYVVFSKDVVGVDENTFILQDKNGRIISSSVIYIQEGKVAVLRPIGLLQPADTYIATLKAGVKSKDGKDEIKKDIVWMFRTFGQGEDTTPPEVIFISPEDGSTNVPTNTQIVIFFSEDINPETIPGNIKILEIETGKEVLFVYEYSRGVLTLKPEMLSPGRTYRVSVRGIEDRAGNMMVGEKISQFTTTKSPAGGGGGNAGNGGGGGGGNAGGGDGGGGVANDTTPPEIKEIYVDNMKINLPDTPDNVTVTPTIKVAFSEKVNPESVNSSSFFISDGVNKISSSISMNLELTAASLSPISPLDTGKTYWVFITSGIEDRAGNNLANPITFSFRTLSPPEIRINSPRDGEYVSGIISIETEFTGTPEKLELWINSLKRQTALPPLSSPFVFQEDTRLYEDGEKIIKVIAYYSGGSNVSYSVRATFDNTPPDIAIQAPSEGEVISGTYTIRAVINDSPDGVLRKVELYIDGVFHSSLISPTSPPNIYDFMIDTTALSDGNHTIEIKAEDMAGNRSSSGVRNVKVDNTPPTVSFSTPTTDDIVGMKVILEANASDTVGIQKVEFFVNSSQICDADTAVCEATTSPYRIIWDSTSISYDPSAVLEVRATDLAGHTTTYKISVTVDNSPPSVGINLPAAGSYLRGTATVEIAHSDETEVTSVVILIDNEELVQALSPSSPYSAVWNTTAYADGTHSIKAVAYDTVGNSRSEEITVVVDNTPPGGTIILPVDGTYTNDDTIGIEVNATDNILVDKVDFYLNGSLIGSDSTSPYQVVADISSLGETSHSITAVVYDRAGNFSETPSPVTFIVDRTPPDVEFVRPLSFNDSPPEGVVDGTETVEVRASDTQLVDTITIEVKGSISLGSCTINSSSGTCIKNWATSGDSTETLRAEARDKAGNVGVTEIVVLVDNFIPAVSVTSPTSGYLRCPTDVVLGGRGEDANSITAIVIRLIDLGSFSESANTIFTFSPPESPAEAFATLTNSECAPDGWKRVEVTAYDRGGKSASRFLDFFVDNTPPGLNIAFPTNTECVSDNPSGTTKVVFDACDDAFLRSLTLYVNSTPVQSVNPSSQISCSSPQTYNFSWRSRDFSDGSATVKVVAVDNAGNFTEQTVNIQIDNSPPTVTINTPADNSVISSPINVNVVLGDSGCAPPSYPFEKVEYEITVSGVSAWASSTDDCSTTGRIPCTDSNVGSGTSSFTWSATEYCGYFVIKARGYDYAGNSAEDTAILKIHPLGCPIDENWSPVPLVGAIRTTPIVRDIDGDGKKELILGTDSGRVYAVSKDTFITNSDAAGSVVRTIPMEVVVSGSPKLIYGTGDGDRRIRALNLTGALLTHFANFLTETAIFSHPATLYADGTTAAVIIGDLKGRAPIYKISSSGFSIMDCIPAGTPLTCGLNSTPIEDSNGDSQPDIVSSPLPVDTDLDGKYDLVVITATDGYITGVDISTKSKVWTIYTGSVIKTSPILADIGNDGNFEILVGTYGGGLYCVSETGGICSSAGWTTQYYTAGGQIYAPPAVVDVDSCLPTGDPSEEIVFGNSGGNLIILSSAGAEKVKVSLGSAVVSSPAIADINGDGCGEIFISTVDGKIHGFYLVNRGGTPYPEYLTGFPVSTGGFISRDTSPVICDLDGDGNIELATGNDSSTLRVFDLGPGSAAGPVKWIPGGRFCTPNAFGCQKRWDTSICGW